MAVFNGELIIKVEFEDFQVGVGYIKGGNWLIMFEAKNKTYTFLYSYLGTHLII